MSTLTFKITLSQGYGATKQINVIGTDLVIDYGDGTTTEQSPDTDGINESHNWLNTSSPKTYTVIITGNIIGLGNSFLQYGYNVTEITLPVGLQSIGNNCLTYIDAEEIIIPSTVSSIGGSFLNNSRHIKKIEIQGEQLTTVGHSFMKGCSEVTSIKLPNSLTMLGKYSFDDCSSLKEFDVPPLVTEWPDPCFQNVTLETLKMNGGPISNPPINENTKIIVPLSKLQEFINHSSYPNERERYDVFGKNLSEKVYVLGVHLAENLQDKNIVASADDGLTTLAEKIDDIYVNIPKVIIEDDTVTDFADLRFTFIVPKNCTSIKINCFAYCENLKYCILPEGITRFYDSAFKSCHNLVELEIPSTVTYLATGSLDFLPSLETLRFKSVIPPTVQSEYNFRDIPTTCTIEVPQESLSAYESAQYYPDPNTYTYVGY